MRTIVLESEVLCLGVLLTHFRVKFEFCDRFGVYAKYSYSIYDNDWTVDNSCIVNDPFKFQKTFNYNAPPIDDWGIN